MDQTDPPGHNKPESDCGDDPGPRQSMDHLPKPKFNMQAIFRQIFSRHEIAEWLLSREETPQLSLSREALSQDNFAITSSISFDDRSNLVIFGMPVADDPPADIEILQQAEVLSYVLHASGEDYCLTTVSDDRVPFAYVEKVSPPVQGVRRGVTLKLEDDVGVPNSHATIGYHWLKDGRSSLTVLCYSIEPTLISEKHSFLFHHYPDSRYPKMSDILEQLTATEEPICQYCILRGNLQCECAKAMVQRTVPMPPPSQQRQAWPLLQWNWLQYELGARKYAVTLSNLAKNMNVTLPVVHQTGMFHGNYADQRRGMQHYLAKLGPHYNRQMIGSSQRFGARIGGVGPIAQQPQPLLLVGTNTETAEPVLKPEGSSAPRLRKRERSPETGHQSQTTGSVTRFTSAMYIEFNPDIVAASKGKKRVSPEKLKLNEADKAASVEDPNPPAYEAAASSMQHKASTTDERSDSASQNQGQESAEISAEDREAFLAYMESLQSISFSASEGHCCRFCPSSERIYNKRHDLMRHLRTSHLQERKFTCAQCAAKFKRRSHLEVHIKTVHEASQSFRCIYCEKVYTSDSTRRKHCRIVHNTEIYD